MGSPVGFRWVDPFSCPTGDWLSCSLLQGVFYARSKTIAGGGLTFCILFYLLISAPNAIATYYPGISKPSVSCNIDSASFPTEAAAIQACQSRYDAGDYPYCDVVGQSSYGWNVVCYHDDPDGGGTSPDPEPVKLTATIKYDVNGGSGTVKDQSKTSTTSGKHTFELRDNPATPPAGESFLGWAMDGTATKPMFQPHYQLTVQYGATITLYAVYGTQGSDTNDCVVQMPASGAPEGLSQLGVIAVGLGLIGVSIGLMRRRS